MFSKSEGWGSAQHLRAPGEARLEVEGVASIYKVACDRRGLHPVLKFFLVAVGIVIGLGLIYHCGKEALFRKRV